MTIGTDTLFSDNFNRSNGSLGANWTTVSGSPAISSNQFTGGSALIASASNFANANYSVQLDAYMKGDYDYMSDGVAGDVTLYARHNGSNTYYYARAHTDGSTGSTLDVVLYKVVAGTSTLLASYGYSDSVTAFTTWRLDADGTSIKFFGDGGQILSATDSSITAIGLPGAGGTGDNFVVKGTSSGGGGTETKTASDSGSLAIAETATKLSMSTLAESGALAVAESASITTFVVASDSGSLSISDGVTASANLSTSDSGSISAAESAAVSGFVAVSDTPSIGLAETVASSLTSSIGDGWSIGLAESPTASAGFTQVPASDTASLSVTEGTPVALAAAAAADSPALSITEGTPGLFSVSAVADSAAMSIGEAVTLAVTTASGDTLSLALAESASAGSASTQVSASDSLAVSTAETTAILGSALLADTLALALAESPASFVASVLADSLAISISESVSAGGGASTKTASDALSFDVTEWVNPLVGDTPVHVSDTLSLGFAETPTFGGYPPQTITVRVWDPETQTWGAPFTAVVGGGITGSTIGFSVSDGLSFDLVETASIFVTRAAALADTLALTLSETAAPALRVQTADTAAISVAESASLFQAETKVVGDTLSLAAGETLALFSATSVVDPLVLGALEDTRLLVQLQKGDTLALAVVESVVGGSTSDTKAAADTLVMGLGEAVQAAPFTLLLGYVVGTVEVKPAVDGDFQVTPTVAGTIEVNA